MDRFSPVAPAQIRVLVLPVGRIERSRYLAFLNRLRNEGSVIGLAELESYNSSKEQAPPQRSFAQSSLLYNYTVSPPSEPHQQLSPFELFREPLLVLGVKDALNDDEPVDQKELQAASEYLRERHPRVVLRQLLVLQNGEHGKAILPHNVIPVRNVVQSQDPSLRYAVCQFSTRFLLELDTYVQAMQAAPTVQTPGQTARRLQRTTSLKEHEKQAVSGSKTPPQSLDLSRSVDPSEDGRSSSAPISRSPPPTSFDQIPSANGVPNRPSRPDSRASNNNRSSVRASSQDRISTQGFGSGSGTSQEKMKTKGKARVGIVVGFLYLIAGEWNEALRMFIEHTSKARVLSDLLWHAKGLEGMVVCMLLHSWAGLEFQVPSICYPTGERPASANGQRFSVDGQFQSRPADQPTSKTTLLSCLPDLLKFTLGLYCSGEGSLELPSVSVADVAIRFSKLLATIRNAGGELSRDAMDSLIKIKDNGSLEAKSAPPTTPSMTPAKSTVVDMLTKANIAGDENVSVADQAAILAGTASVYALLQMNRKKAATIKAMVEKLTGALIQARKRGAAEAGIHPAASLSADNGAQVILSIAEDSDGLGQMMLKVAAIYGIALGEHSTLDFQQYGFRHFGNDTLKVDFLKALAAFCEVSPDPAGLLRINASALRTFGPNAAVDAEPLNRLTSLSKEEQLRCVVSINRNIGVSKLIGLPEVEATYWDDFLVRDIEFIPAESEQPVADLSKLKKGQAIEQTPGNPLLYDPNENRPRTADEVKPTSILVPNEVSLCRITLQNPYEAPVDVESIRLVSEGEELETSHQRFTLSPFGIQRVSISVSPRSPGNCKITGCLVKIQDCCERRFGIVSKPWFPEAPLLIKHSGEDKEVTTEGSKERQMTRVPEYATVSVTVIDPQPTLVIENNSFIDSTLMLLDGEASELNLTVRNISNIAASIFDILSTNDAVQLQRNYANDVDDEDDTSSATSDPNEPTILEPGESVSFTFDVTGKPTVFQVKVSFHYCCQHNPTHARILSVPINMTVNAGLQVQRLAALPMDLAQNDEYSFVFCLDVANAWPKPMFYSCFVSDLGLKSAEPRRCHNHEGMLAPGQSQRVFMPVARPLELDDSDDVEAFRKCLLGRLRIIWSVDCEERMGEVDVSSLPMSAESLKIVAGEAIYVNLEIVGVENEVPLGPGNVMKAGSFATLRAKLFNRASRSYPLVCQLQSRALYTTNYTQSDKHVAVAGAQHRFVPPIPQGGEEVVDFSFCPLLPGVIELEAFVRAALPKDENGSQWASHRRLYLTVT